MSKINYKFTDSKGKKQNMEMEMNEEDIKKMFNNPTPSNPIYPTYEPPIVDFTKLDPIAGLVEELKSVLESKDWNQAWTAVQTIQWMLQLVASSNININNSMGPYFVPKMAKGF